MRMSYTQKFGLRGELWVKEQLQAQGYSVRLIEDWYDDYDLLVDNFLPVEVKTARVHQRTIRPGYSRTRPVFGFETARIPQDNDFVIVLLCYDQEQLFWPYVAPSWMVAQRVSIAITSHPRYYGGMWAKYLNNWSMVDRVIGIRQRLGQSLQLPLWDRILDRNGSGGRVSQNAR